MSTHATARLHRIRQLAAVISRATAELETLLRAEASIRGRAGEIAAQVPPDHEFAPEGASEAERIRIWARAQGISVHSTGRIRKAVREAYEQAHGGAS